MFIKLRKQTANVHNKNVIGLGLFIVVIATSCMAVQQALPADYQLLAELNLADQDYEAETIGEFRLEETAVTSILYTIPNIDTAYFDLSLIGLDGETHLILHSEDYQTDAKGGGAWEQSLPPGVYRLVLTAHQSPGVLSVYWIPPEQV